MIHDKKMSSLPRYLIVDREGNMVVKDAKRPSDGQALYDQLAEQFGPRFATPKLLREMADKTQSFYGRFGGQAAAA